MSTQPTMYDDIRLSPRETYDLTAASLNAYGPAYDHWSFAYSGGKDSTTLLTAVAHMIRTGVVRRPKRLTVLYADTRMELPPLVAAARAIMGEMGRGLGAECRTVMAPIDERFFVYMLGRGVPPPNNNTLRWCTAQIKVEPMQAELRRMAAAEGAGRKVLMMIGVRVGESAARDARIALACGRNGAECGQGWYQRDLPDAICDKLSPILHWRTCLVWDWLADVFGRDMRHGFATHMVADAYDAGADGSKHEVAARTGCVGCPLATEDIALGRLVKRPEWAYLSPLLRLRPIYRELREPRRRLRQPGGERRKDGTLTGNQNRMGPLTMEARLWALDQILAIQAECNAGANGRPAVDILNAEEEARIRELIAANTWPNKWTGAEPTGDELYEETYTDGTRQLLLPTIHGRASS